MARAAALCSPSFRLLARETGWSQETRTHSLDLTGAKPLCTFPGQFLPILALNTYTVVSCFNFALCINGRSGGAFFSPLLKLNGNLCVLVEPELQGFLIERKEGRKENGQWREKVGHLCMTDDWFSEYVYEVVVDKKHVPEEVLAVLEQEPVVLPAWDPMGALAE
ncbi:hypothetical protein MC885_012062 [Smutsia gigantea]|nr:hypothetical protein MC885_012062 [Smutsia gigantea]